MLSRCLLKGKDGEKKRKVEARISSPEWPEKGRIHDHPCAFINPSCTGGSMLVSNPWTKPSWMQLSVSSPKKQRLVIQWETVAKHLSWVHHSIPALQRSNLKPECLNNHLKTFPFKKKTTKNKRKENLFFTCLPHDFHTSTWL